MAIENALLLEMGPLWNLTYFCVMLTEVYKLSFCEISSNVSVNQFEFDKYSNIGVKLKDPARQADCKSWYIVIILCFRL